MAGEINLPGGVSGGNAVYVLLNESGQWYNTAGAAFEAYNAANIADYDAALTERGTTGIFSNGSALPTLARGNYGVLGVMIAGASLAESDFPPFAAQNLKWTGSAEEGVIDVDSDGAAESAPNWAKVTNPTTTVGLSGTTVKTATDVETDTADIQSRLPAALTGAGNMKADVLAISDDAAAANALEALLDGTGAALSATTITASGTTTLTGNVAMAAGLNITQSASNASALVVTGNGTGSGAVFTSGTGNNAHGLVATSNSASAGHGISATGAAIGHGINALSGTGSSGSGINAESQATSGPGMLIVGNGNAWGLEAVGDQGGAAFYDTTLGSGLCELGSVLGGVVASGLGTGIPGIKIDAVNGNGITVAATGASRHGVSITGGTGGTSDGMNIVAGTGGVALRAGSVVVTGATTLTGAVSLGSTLGVTGAFTATHASNQINLGIDALNATVLAASAVTEIQAGLALASSFTFTVAGQVDCNVKYVNDVQVTGTGASGDEWGPT